MPIDSRTNIALKVNSADVTSRFYERPEEKKKVFEQILLHHSIHEIDNLYDAIKSVDSELADLVDKTAMFGGGLLFYAGWVKDKRISITDEVKRTDFDFDSLLKAQGVNVDGLGSNLLDALAVNYLSVGDAEHIPIRDKSRHSIRNLLSYALMQGSPSSNFLNTSSVDEVSMQNALGSGTESYTKELQPVMPEARLLSPMRMD